MSERTEWDDTVDKAIERLIDDETEGFVLTAIEDDDLHLVKATDDIDGDLLSIYVMVEEIRMMAAEAGEEMSPMDVVMAAGAVAERRGYLDGEMTLYDGEPED
jgi:hypothetical protein